MKTKKTKDKNQGMNITNIPEYQSVKKQKEADYYYSLFQKAYNFNQTRSNEYKELTAFYELSQHELPEYQIEKPWVMDINAAYATDAVNLRVASLQASDYMGELEPLSPDDTETIETLNYAYKSMWQEMNMDKHINESILRAAVTREAYTHIIYEDKEVGGTNRKRKGKLVPYFISPTSMYIDPKALDLKNADFMIVVDRLTPKQVKSKYPKFSFSEHKDRKSTMYSPSERGEGFYGTDYTTEQDFILTKLTFYEKEDDKVYKTVLVENQIVIETEELPIPVFPIAQLRWQKKIKSPYGTSLMDMLLPLQKTINEIESAIANTALQFSNPSYVLSEEAGINPEDLALTAGTPGAVYLVQAGVDIDKVVRPLINDRKVDAELIQVKQELERTIYKLAGVSDQFLGDLGTVGNTKTGTDLAVQRAKIIEQKFLTNLEEYVEDLSTIILSFLTHIFDGDTLYVRGNKKAKGEFDFEQRVIPENAQDLEYTFYIKLDVKTKYSKDQHRQVMKELYEVQQQYDAPIKGINFIDVLKQYELPNTEELVQRLEHLTQMDAEQRAQLIMELTNMANQYQIDPQMLQQAVTELILGLPETPVLDMIVTQMEQTQMQQEMARETVSDAIRKNMINKAEEQMAPPEPTGDEELSIQN